MKCLLNAYSVLHVPPYRPRETTEWIVRHYLAALLSFHTIAVVITILPDPPTVGKCIMSLFYEAAVRR